MSKCPFWSNGKLSIDCNSECPMICGENGKKEKEEQCIFLECSPSIDLTVKDEIKEDYSFLNLNLYDEDKSIRY